MDGTSIFQMVSGLGSSFGDAYSSAVKERQEAEAPSLLENLMSAYRGGAAAVPATGVGVPAGGTVAPAAPPSTPTALPSFAGGGGAPMRIPGSGGDIENRFVDSLKAGGLTNPYGLAAMAAYAGHESGYKPGNITGSWSDPSESGQPGISGGILSWRGDRFANMRRLTAGAKDPVAAQAVFALTENPDLTLALQNAKSPEEANRTMARAWKFAGYDRPGGEFEARLGSTRQYLARLGGTPSAGAPPTQVAAAEPDTANMPAVGAQPVGFNVPGAGVEAPSQAFSGFGAGAGASRMTPELRTALNAAWKNPNTRAVAAQVFGQLLKGQDNGWELKDVNGQSAWVNGRDGRILPIGQAKRNTATVGNNLVDTATGEVLFTAADKDSSKFTYQAMPGVGMVALHSTDPTQSRVIIAGQQPRPLTAEERQSYGIPEGTGAGMGSDGKPFDIGGGGKTTINVDTKGAGKFAEKANELQAKRYGEIVDASDNAVRLRGDVETLAELGSQIATGKGAQVRLTMAQYAKAIGLDSVADGLTGGKLGEMEAFGAIADRLTPQMRVPGSGATSDMEMRTFRNSLPSLLKTPEGNKIVTDTFRGLLDHQAAAGEIAGKAMRGEMAQAEADQAIRALPGPFVNFKSYRKGQGEQGGSAAQGAKVSGTQAVPKRVEGGKPPAGYTWESFLGRAQQTVKERPDLRPQLEEMLANAGIPPERLGR